MARANPFSRRHFLQTSALATSSIFCTPSRSWGDDNRRTKKKVAAITTIYRYNSHADVILGKILSGWKQDGGKGPDLELVSLYVDQFPDDDMARALSKKHGFPIYSTIGDAITLGTNQVAVDGVISIGEHGDYPWNEKEQHLYPRRRFFAEITATLEKCGKVVPIFNDKHPGPQWDDALWMYRRAQELKIPWMAGSSLPVSYRSPDVTLKWHDQVKTALAIGYSGLDIYGFHTLDFMQTLLERRNGGEQGVEWVQSHPCQSIGEFIANGQIDSELLDRALSVTSGDRQKMLAEPASDGALFMIKYCDGLLVPVLMLPGNAQGIATAIRNTKDEIMATKTEERPDPRHPHFAYLLKGIEQMIHTGKPAYPVERSLLTAGMLDRLLTSRLEHGKRIETPELAIAYTPVDYSYAPHLPL